MNRRNLLIGGGSAAALGLAALTLGRGPSYEAAADAVWTPQQPPGAGGELEFLVRHATLAANSHNTQPWLFSGGAAGVTIRPDPSRATPAVDPDNHHLYASLGCAAENLGLAASALGRSAAIGFEAGADAIRVDLGAAGAATDPLFEAIPQRQSNRSDYDGRAVDAEDLAACAAAASIEGCEVMLITDRPRMEEILALIIAANSAQIADPAFVAELRHWLRFNPAQAIRQRDGLYSGCTGNPSMPGWLADVVFPLAFGAKGENDKIVRQVRSSAGFAAFVSARDDPAHWVQAGRSFQRFALAATARGLSQAFLNQPLEVAAYRPQLAALLGTGGRRPDLLIRFGRGQAMPRSLRRPPAEVMIAA